MADNYLEKRYDEVFGSGRTKVKRVGHPLDELLLRTRSCRGYLKDYVVKQEELERIVGVCGKIPSARNQQVLRFRLVTKGDGANIVNRNIRLGAALPELHLPFPGTEPEAFIIICSTAPESKMVDIDLGIAIQSMLLKAVEMGLNGICIGAFNKQEAMKFVSEGKEDPSGCNTDERFLEPLLVIALGKGAERYQILHIAEDQSHNYFRENGIHYIPKVRAEDLIL